MRPEQKKPSESQKSERLFGDESVLGRVRNFMIQLANKISWAEKNVWICGKNISKTRLRLWQSRWNAWKIPSGAGFLVRSLVASRGDCNGLQYCGREDFAKDVGRALLGRRLALPGSMGCCVLAHKHLASGMYLGSAGQMESSFSSIIKKELKPFCSCGDGQGMCFD